MEESKEILTLRQMSWQRAKGELNALLHTFWPVYSPSNGRPLSSSFDPICKIIEKFQKDMDDNM